MSNQKSAIQEIKNLMVKFGFMSDDSKTEAVREIFVDATLEDGTKITIEGDVIELGKKVSVAQGDAMVPAPDGVHTLDNGDKVTTVDGVITEFLDNPSAPEEGEKGPEAPSLEAAAVDSPEITAEEKAKPKEDMEMVDMLKEFITKMSSKINEMESNYSSLKDEFKSFAKEPAAKKIAGGKTDFNKVAEDEVDTRLNAILALKNKINN